MPSTVPIALGTSEASASGARSTNHTPSRIFVEHLCCDLQREASLADAAGARKRYQAMFAQQNSDLASLFDASNERGQLQRKIVLRTRRSDGPRRQRTRPAPVLGKCVKLVACLGFYAQTVG